MIPERLASIVKKPLSSKHGTSIIEREKVGTEWDVYTTLNDDQIRGGVENVGTIFITGSGYCCGRSEGLGYSMTTL